MITQKELFAKALMIEKPWFIEDIEFEPEESKLEIWINYEPGSSFYYKDEALETEGYYKAYDSSLKTWRHLNFFQYECYLNAWIPRVDIGKGKKRQVKAPWEGQSYGFTLLFEALILELVKLMPVHQVSQLLGVYDAKLWKMMDDYVTLTREQEDLSEVKIVGVDETSVRKGHNYVSLMVDLEEKRTLFVTEGKGHEVVDEFVKDLELHHGAAENIRQISCDMSPAFIKGVEKNLPEAVIVFDRFHVTKIINEAVDKVRKEEAKSNPILKGSRYLFLKNRENLTKHQTTMLDTLKISGLNLKTMRALSIREAFQQIYQASTPAVFERLLKKWYFWATHSRIPYIIEAAKTIKRHWNGIITWINYQINNGILEGFNSIFQAAKAKARGYKKTNTIKTIIYILTGNLDFSIVNQYYVTHTIL